MIPETFVGKKPCVAEESYFLNIVMSHLNGLSTFGRNAIRITDGIVLP